MATIIESTDGLKFQIQTNWLCTVRMTIKKQERPGLPESNYNKTEMVLITRASIPSDHLVEQRAKLLLDETEELVFLNDIQKNALLTLDPAPQEVPEKKEGDIA